MSQPKLSDAEWTVMNVLWERSPANARDVLMGTAGERDWAYTTVKTLLDRLVEKGAVRATKRANVLFYEPLVGRGTARRDALRGLVDRAFEGAFGSLVHHLIAEERLSKRERTELRKLLDERDARARRKRGGSKE